MLELGIFSALLTLYFLMMTICVKKQRINVAKICMGNIGHVRGAAAVCIAKQDPEEKRTQFPRRAMN